VNPVAHPEFEPSLPGLIAEATLEALRADPAVAQFFTSIEPYESEGFFSAVTAPSSFAPPALAVLLEAWEYVRAGSNRAARYETVIQIAAVLSQLEGRGTEQWLHARILDHIIRIFEKRHGVLLIDNDELRPITEALLQAQRVRQPARVGQSSVFVKRLYFVFQSRANALDGTFLEA
jgi:hypothetical protein